MSPQDFSTNVLVVGGAFAGLSAITSLQNHISERCKYSNAFSSRSHKLSITVIEPRAGLLNILGIPHAVLDPEFAQSQYLPLHEMKTLHIETVHTPFGELIQQVRPKVYDEAAFSIHFVQGKVTNVARDYVDYHLVESRTIKRIKFDYIVLAMGRDRLWPITPDALTADTFLDEMNKTKNILELKSSISIVGGGAVGIEMAGCLKRNFPDKCVRIIHPHDRLLPEPLSNELKDTIFTSLTSYGVDVMLNTRIKEELDNGYLVTTTNDTIKSDLTIWCTNFRNNLDILDDVVYSKAITNHQNLAVNEYLQIEVAGDVLDNVFAIGDIVELDIIKSAGWAMYMGRQTANNIASDIFEGKLAEKIPDMKTVPRGMVIVAGNEEIVSELSGEVEVNNRNYVEEYKDYCMGKIRVTIGV
ncbi:uncharacterized protein KQ657_000903 [Scheffersomyces spartinae]|uniref:FAD/NAD(P)-binding domain-containing protein n=1 Tax=Scheffersomyces spartinae TaxID=45513 RepID=A0A9P7V8H2_9ASCO|nr:uncharacterized protein KQ657_000903 [Scheffersomyces spartinae]KAG7193149.1 hypothetical protein KQ657_000903 [Scheffersomyces spartinae]